MMDEPGGSVDQLPPIPGSSVAIENEGIRLNKLGQSLEELGDLLARTQAETWRGDASEQFEESRIGLVSQCRKAADAHLAAANGLSAYQETLADVQQRRKYEVEKARANPSAIAEAKANIIRWRQHLASAALTSGHLITVAGVELAGIRRLLLDEVLPAQRPAPRQAPKPVSVDPLDANFELVAYQQQCREVCDAVFAACAT